VRKPQINNEDFCNAFGAHVRKLREQRGLSMRELASNLDVEYNQIYRIENGKINTSISMVILLAEGLGVSHQQIFDFKYSSRGKK
jgi:transcriptional regulator with XRE-family HTH domain